MIPICLVFNAHQPYRLGTYNYFDVGRSHDYFDARAMARRLARAETLCYGPAAKMLARLLERHRRFSFALSLSGPLLDQLRTNLPELLSAFRRLVATGRVEPLSATSHHCLAWAVSPAEIETQIRVHREHVRHDLGREAAVFGGEEPSEAAGLSALAAPGRFSGLLLSAGAPASGAARGRLYRAGSSGIPAMGCDESFLRELARVLSDRRSGAFPAAAEELDRWISTVAGDILCLSMNLESFGLRPPGERRVLAFFETWIGRAISRADTLFLTPSEAFARIEARGSLPREAPPARPSNALQRDARASLAALEGRARAAGKAPEAEDFRRLTASDHFDRMALSPGGGSEAGTGTADSPYEAYMAFRHAVADLERRLARPRPAPALAAGPPPA